MANALAANKKKITPLHVPAHDKWTAQDDAEDTFGAASEAARHAVCGAPPLLDLSRT
jgi:hypothetical protein